LKAVLGRGFKEQRDAAVTSPRPNALERLCSTLGITANDAVVASLEALLRRTRRELYECARELGLTRLSRLGKEALARRVLAPLNRGAAADDGPASNVGSALRQ
jgi:hypothetical protein